MSNALIASRVAVAFAAALTLSVSAKAADDILIGFHGPMTGPASWVGTADRDGAMIALQEINAAGGINGRKLRLIAYDDANNPSEAETVSKKLIESDKVFAILGGGASNTAVVVARVAAQEKVPYLNSSGATPKVMDIKSRWVFSVSTIDVRDIAENEAAFIGKHLKPKSIAFLHAADETSVPLIDALSKLLKDNYHIETVSRQTYNRGDTDFSSQIIGVQRAKPDMLMLSGAYIEEARIVRQARELGIRLPIKGDTSSMNTGLLTIAGPAAEGMFVSYVVPYIKGDPAEDMVKFETKFQKAYPGKPADQPNYVDMFGYGTMYTIAEGLKRAGTDLTPKHFVEALETLSEYNPSSDWSDAVNVIEPLTFTKSHNGNRRMSHFLVKSGAFTRVESFIAPVPSTPFPANATLDW